MRKLVLLAVAIASAVGFADVMDKKAKVIATVETPRSGGVEITCDDPAGWSFAPSVSEDAGRDVVTVRLTSPKASKPPQFGVFFRVPGAGVQNVWTSDFSKDGFHLWPRLWWNWLAKYSSQLASEVPIAVGFNSMEESRVALACSETFEKVEFGLYADDRTCDIIGRCEFFTQAVADRKEYVARILIDRRGRPWYETVKESAAWIDAVNGFKPADVPDAAYDPLYSTWYAYLQDVHDRELEDEARLAAQVGMKTMILDDGWQKEDSKTFYSATGDWMPVKGRFPDMKRHVAEVHKAGLKYMLWLSVPFMGNEAKNYPRFKKMLLSGTDTGVLDPRFPEVREYLISTYERVVGEWGFDGVKLDFIDNFTLPEVDPAVKENYAGRDYRSLPEAVDRLMKDVLSRLKKINPDALVEFRQHYMGPAIRQYGNMIRAADCPADPTANRRRICDLRLTSGRTAVHSDMLVWSKDETPEGAALPILNVLFSTIQYSMILAKTNPEHLRVMRRWLAFTQEHRETLLKGEFRPHHPESGYPIVEAEGVSERIVTVYSPTVCARVTSADKPVILVNVTGAGRLLVSLPARPVRVEAFDVFGDPVPLTVPREGLSEIGVPASGHVRIEFPSADCYSVKGRVGKDSGWKFVESEAGKTVYIPFEGYYESKGGRMESPRFPIPEGMEFARLTFAAKAAEDGYWWVDLFDEKGAPLPDVNSRLYASSDWTNSEVVMPIDPRARTAQIAFVTGKGVAVRDVAFAPIAVAAAAGWCDRFYGTLPQIERPNTAGCWTKAPRAAAALREGRPLRGVLLGDSIMNDTYCGNFTALVKRMFPKSDLSFLISVRGSTGCWHYRKEAEFKKYVADLHPDLVLIGGISNGDLKQTDDPEGAMREVVRKCRGIGAEVVICSPPPSYEWRTSSNDAFWDEMWRRPTGSQPMRSDFERKVAREEDVPFWDLTKAPCDAICASRRPLGWFKRDTAHNDDRGKQLIARTILAYFEAAVGRH